LQQVPHISGLFNVLPFVTCNRSATESRAVHWERRRELARAWVDLILESARPAAELLVGPRP
jgi:hypothetical protein